MKRMIVIAALLLAAGCGKKEEPAALETAVVKANSMVCGSCAKTVREAVAKVDGVRDVNVDIKTKTVEVKFLPAVTNLGNIETAITAAGYDANDRKRDPAAYEKLDKCCKIDG